MGIPRSYKGLHIHPVLISDVTSTLTAAQQKYTVKVSEKLADKELRGMLPHAIGLFIRQDLDLSFTTAPTQVGNAAQLARLIFKADNQRVMFDLSGPDIRALEAYEGGGSPAAPDPDLNAGTGNNIYSERVLSFAPEGFEGAPTDYALPVSLLLNSTIEMTIGSYTAASADGTAGTVRERIYLMVVTLGEVRIPPKVSKRSFDCGANKLEMGDRSLVTSLFLLNSSSHDAITTGDLATLTLDDRKGALFSGLNVEIMTAMYRLAMNHGPLGLIQGEPESAYDDNAKTVSGATPTALVASGAFYQPAVFSQGGQRISKVEVESPLTLKWSGTQAAAYALCTRIEPRSEDEAKELAQRVFRVASLPYAGGHIKTLSKKTYSGPRAEYMPWVFNYRK